MFVKEKEIKSMRARGRESESEQASDRERDHAGESKCVREQARERGDGREQTRARVSERARARDQELEKKNDTEIYTDTYTQTQAQECMDSFIIRQQSVSKTEIDRPTGKRQIGVVLLGYSGVVLLGCERWLGRQTSQEWSKGWGESEGIGKAEKLLRNSCIPPQASASDTSVCVLSNCVCFR